MKRVALTVVTALLAGCATEGGERSYLAQLDAAERRGVPFDPVTASHPDTSVAQAYDLQRRYVARRVRAGERVAGYKGGLMSAASLKARNAAEPLVAVLFASGRVDDGGTVSLCGYRKASYELKLAYLFDTPAPRTVLPVIDLPDIAYRDPERYGAVDMIAANVSAARFVRGTPRPTDGIDLDSLRVSISRDGAALTAGTGRESLGAQRTGLDTLLALIRRTGRAPVTGDVIVTGKIGDRGWLLPGRYVADYGPLGQVRFTVAACTR